MKIFDLLLWRGFPQQRGSIVDCVIQVVLVQEVVSECGIGLEDEMGIAKDDKETCILLLLLSLPSCLHLLISCQAHHQSVLTRVALQLPAPYRTPPCPH